MKFKSAFILIGIIIVLSIVIFGMITVPYFLNFKSSMISDSVQDWGAFGGFIAGITSIINLSVFIILTIYISRLSSASSDKQIQNQKKTLISQFRQTEINKLNDELDRAFTFTGEEKKGELINIYIQVSIYLTNFQNQKQYLFPILIDKVVKNRINLLLEKYDQLSLIIDEIHDKENIEIEKQKKLETKIQFTVMMKNEIIEALQKFVLDELDK